MVYWTTSVAGPFKVLVVKHYQLMVSGEPDIQFYAVGTGLSGSLECRQGIFRRNAQVATMADYQRQG